MEHFLDVGGRVARRRAGQRYRPHASARRNRSAEFACAGPFPPLVGRRLFEGAARQHRASLAMARTFDGFDLIMTPATADLPPLIGAVRGDDAAFDYAAWVDRAYGFAPFTEIFNVTGQPAASLPLFLSKDGLPIG
ncbi:hypothetical protein EOA32_38010, partial [Mesorhizobium sp. M1A.F.Ca.ET.072.01.1.1]